jgi:hypothetical protein
MGRGRLSQFGHALTDKARQSHACGALVCACVMGAWQQDGVQGLVPQQRLVLTHPERERKRVTRAPASEPRQRRGIGCPQLHVLLLSHVFKL